MIRQILAIFILVTSIAVYAQEPQLIPYRKGKLWGYSTPDKKMVIQPKWQETTFFVDGVAAVKQDNKWGLINEEGKEIIPIQYEYISNFVNGYAVARLPVPNSLQLINVKGEIKEYGIQASGGLDTELDGGYSSLSLYKSGLMALRNKDRKYGLTTIDGKEVLPFQYESIREMENGYLLTESEVVYAYKTKIIKLDPKMHYARHRQPEKLIDTKNKTITVMITKEEQKLLEAYGYSTEASQKGVKYEGLVSPNGEVILPAIYDRINKLNENLMTIEKDRKIGLVTVKGEQITLLKYSSIGEFSEGLATFSIGDKYGYMNEKGEEVIPAKYLRTGRLVNGYGFAEKETGWGFLSKEGEEIGSFEYSSVRPFSEGLAAVEKRYLVGYINEQGEEVIPLIYKQEIQPFTSGAAIMAKDAVIGRGQVYGILPKLSFIQQKMVMRLKFQYLVSISFRM